KGVWPLGRVKVTGSGNSPVSSAVYTAVAEAVAQAPVVHPGLRPVCWSWAPRPPWPPTVAPARSAAAPSPEVGSAAESAMGRLRGGGAAGGTAPSGLVGTVLRRVGRAVPWRAGGGSPPGALRWPVERTSGETANEGDQAGHAHHA